MQSTVRPLDLIVIVAYLALTMGLGLWMGRSQKNARDYFVAERAIPWWAILVSIVATETSALTFISIPGLAYAADMSFLQIAFGYIIGRTLISYTLLPLYFEGELVTAYAFLEKRFGLATRRFASIIFLITRALADAVRLFGTAIPVALILAPFFPKAWVVPASIVLISFSTLVYTYFGGMRAVIWTDVLQTSVYLAGGAVAVILIGAAFDPSWIHGWGIILTQARQAGKLQVFDLYTGFDRPHTLMAGLIGGAFLSMASHGVDQTIVQRLLAASHYKHARRALIGSGFAVAAQFAFFLFIGVGLHFYYHGKPFESSDQVFPKFVLEAMPAGVTGLVLAAILAATMSVHSGALNSLAAVATHDIFVPLSQKKHGSENLLKIGRIFTLFWGVLLGVMALTFQGGSTPVVTVALSIASFTFGGLLGGFFAGLIPVNFSQTDVLIGMSSSIAVMMTVVLGKLSMAWPWYVITGTAVTLLACTLASFIRKKFQGPVVQ